MEWFVPDRAEEVGDWLRALAPDARPVVTGAAPGEGLEARAAGASIVSTARLNALVDYRPRDLTLTVGAGMRAERVREITADQGQWLPAVEPFAGLPAAGPGPSVGGLVAGAPAGPLDGAFGPVRRQVLACRVVAPNGESLRWGRPVVKNVAGYDLPRLLCGSRGRLGVITEVTLRLWPRPAEWRTVRLDGPQGPWPLAAALAAPDGFEPEAAVWRPDADGGESLFVTLCGSGERVAARERALRAWAAGRGAELQPREDAGGADSSASGATDGGRPPRRLTSAAFRLTVGRGYLPPVLAHLRQHLNGEPVAIEAYPGLGVARLEVERGGSAEERPAPAWLVGPASREALAPHGARLLVERGSEAEHAAAEALREREALALERRVTAALGGWERHWLGDYV